jgi:hypothetical protein
VAKFTASVKIDASSNLDKVAGKSTKALDKLSRKSGMMSANMDRLGASALKLSKRLGILAVAGFGAVIFKGAQFEAQLKDLSALTGLTGDQLSFAGDEALRMSKKYGLAGKDIINATKLVASARSELLKDPDALLRISEQAIILAKAQRIDLVQATNAVTTSMNQFSLQTEDASRVINVLAAGSKVGASFVEDTATAIERAGVAMKITNVSLEEGNAAIQVLAKNGILGARAGTQLKIVLSRLARSGDEFNPTVVGLSTALENLAAEELDASQLIKGFGEEAFATGKILIDNRKLLGEWTKEMTGTNVAVEQADKNLEAFSATAARLKSRSNEALIRAFKSEAFTKMLTQLDMWLEKTDALAILFDTIAESVLLIGSFLTPTGRPSGIAGDVTATGETAIGALDVGGIVGLNAPQQITIKADFSGLPTGANVNISSPDDIEFQLDIGDMLPAL